MLYLDYSRKAGEWVPNEYGGNEDLDAISFLRELNEVAYGREPGIAIGGRGVDRVAGRVAADLPRRARLRLQVEHGLDARHARLLPARARSTGTTTTTSSRSGCSTPSRENFVLPLSHDEVVHGKGSLLTKMPGDDWQQFANLRALYGLHVGAPGQEAAVHGRRACPASASGTTTSTSTGTCSSTRPTRACSSSISDLNRAYQAEPALWEVDHDSSGFRWIEANDADANTLCFLRCSRDGERVLACLCNLSPVPRHDYRVGLPRGGRWRRAR